jgi:hypothetical protein
MSPVNPKADLLRSTDIAGLISDLIRDMRDGPDVLVFLLSQQPDNYDAIIQGMARFKEEYITFSPHTVYGVRFGLCILGFDSSSPVAMSEFFKALSQIPFDEAGIYIQGQFRLRLLPNEELQPSSVQP